MHATDDSFLRGRLRWPRLHPAGIALAGGYLLVGLLWIVFSDSLVQQLGLSPRAAGLLQTWKGVAFVIASAAFVYVAHRLQPDLRADTPAATPVVRRSPPTVLLLALLVLATALPMLVLLGWGIALQTSSQLDSANRLVRDVSQNTASRALVFLEAQSRLAASLSQRPLVRALDRSRCDVLLDEVASLGDAVLAAATFDAEGNPVCGTIAGRESQARAWIGRLRTSGAVQVTPLARDAGSGEWTFSIAHPVFAPNGGVAGALELVYPALALAHLVEGALPPGAIAGLLDTRNVLATRFPDPFAATGQPLRDAAMLRHLRPQADPETFRTTAGDGIERVQAAQAVGKTGWVAFAGVPVDHVYAPARQAFERSAAVALGMVVACTGLVLLLARSITGPLSALRRTAQRAAAGDFGDKAPETGPAELVAVAAGFNQMLERLPQLQRELVDSEARNRTLLEKLAHNVPGMIFTLVQEPGGRWRLPFVSEGLRELFELEPADMAVDAWPAFARIHPADLPQVERQMAVAGAALAKLKMEYRVLLPAAGLQHRLTEAQPERLPDGGVLWYGCTVDVGPLKRSELALREARDTLELRVGERTSELASANEALESFSYSVAHDLRAPLASIGGFTQAIGEALQRGEADKAQAYCDRVAANAARMNELIEGFLALARAGQEPLTHSPVDMRRQVQEVLQDLQPRRDVQVEIGPLPRVHVDQATFRQVWHNLLSNALKYSARRERPVVRIACDADTQAELLFSVQDNGTGFDPAYVDRLFMPFARLHKAGEFEGTGVGLAVVWRIVERHGGRLWATSEGEGAGATFCFALPRERLLGGPLQ